MHALILRLQALVFPFQTLCSAGTRSAACFTSDGKKIGKALATGINEDDHAVLVAEIERPLGIGADAVAIPTELFVRKFHGIELTITDAEVRDRLAGAKHKR